MYYLTVTGYALTGVAFYTLVTFATYPDTLTALAVSSLIFAVLGTLIGVLGFQALHKQQYFLYYNLGFTKRRLIAVTWGVNAIIGLVFALLFFTLA